MVKIKKGFSENANQTKKLAEGNLGDFYVKEKNVETKETEQNFEKTEFREDEIIHKKIRREIETMDLDENLKLQASAKANDMRSLDSKEKIKTLLQIAQKKGVIFAVKVAKNMNDPYILDTFHDALAKEGYYKKFLK
jgi:hypothetical protein